MISLETDVMGNINWKKKFHVSKNIKKLVFIILLTVNTDLN